MISCLRALQKLINTSSCIGFEMDLDFIRNLQVNGLEKAAITVVVGHCSCNLLHIFGK